MTFAFFIILILGLFVAGLNALPVAVPISAGFLSSITMMAGYLKAWDWLLPVTELIISLKIVLGYELTVWLMIATWRVIKFIRGHSDGA